VRLRIIKGPRFSDELFQRLLATLREYLGAGMVFDVEFTDRIEMVRTGKHQGTISRLDLDLQGQDAGADLGAHADAG
jgi:phenylacetate-CoA ligase